MTHLLLMTFNFIREIIFKKVELFIFNRRCFVEFLNFDFKMYFAPSEISFNAKEKPLFFKFVTRSIIFYIPISSYCSRNDLI